MSIIHHGFPPLCDGNSRILILGTFPSPLSRKKNEYYGNPRNQFWRIMHEIFGEPYNARSLGQKSGCPDFVARILSDKANF